MRNKLSYIVKYIRWIHVIYYYLGSLAIRTLKLFIRPDNRTILFISFGGKKYDDSPKVIYEQMINDSRFSRYNFVWAFNNPESISIPKGQKIKTDTLKYYITAIKSIMWITNSSAERGLSFKRKETIYFNTWHGTPLKKMGADMLKSKKYYIGNGTVQYDVFTCQGNYEVEIYKNAYNIPHQNLKILGLARNDIFASYSQDALWALKNKLSIPHDKKVILYAPTFREFENNRSAERTQAIPINLEIWEKELSNKYIVLFRAHYEVVKSLDFIDSPFIKNMSSYPNLEDLMIVSDILISDYSSIFFDFSIMHKPMICFAYDYEIYTKERGLYFDIRKYLPHATKENELLDIIKKITTYNDIEYAINFQNMFVTEYGNGAKNAINLIAKMLNL